MRERVSTIIGKNPVILVAPHGADDTNTALLTEIASQKIDCYAVINRGFERADYVDVNKDIADCNRINHCKEEVVFDEFLKPIIKFQNKILQKSLQINNLHRMLNINNQLNKEKYLSSYPVHIFHIHGCGDSVHKIANERVGVIIGYGSGLKKDSHTCETWRKNLFVDLWRKNSRSGDAFEGKGGGKYAGRDSNNLNQYFRKHEVVWEVQSMQLEFPYSSRNTPEETEKTANFLADLISNYITFHSWSLRPNPKFI